jgi:hypothetical protein
LIFCGLNDKIERKKILRADQDDTGKRSFALLRMTPGNQDDAKKRSAVLTGRTRGTGVKHLWKDPMHGKPITKRN